MNKNNNSDDDVVIVPAIRPKSTRIGSNRSSGLGIEARRSRVIEAAQRVFLSKGYHCARMDDIAHEAVMSKRTIYQMFASKEDLFEALLTDRMPPGRPCSVDDARPLEEILADLVLESALWLLSPNGVAIARLIMGEYSRSPGLGRLFKREGHKRFISSLERCLTALAATKLFQFDDIREAATMLTGMVLCDIHFDLVAGVEQPPSKPMIKRRVDRAVRIFLNGTRTGCAGPALGSPPEAPSEA